MSPRKTISPDERTPQVRAAGGVLWRSVDAELLVAVVHRPLYSDWTFPKGKLDPGETDEEAARREVLEETSFVCDLEEELPSVHYLDHKGRTRQVRYWKMIVRSGEFAASKCHCSGDCGNSTLGWHAGANLRHVLSNSHRSSRYT